MVLNDLKAAALLNFLYVLAYIYIYIQYTYRNMYTYGTSPPGTHVWMELVASVVETHLFQWLFEGFILWLFGGFIF